MLVAKGRSWRQNLENLQVLRPTLMKENIISFHILSLQTIIEVIIFEELFLFLLLLFLMKFIVNRLEELVMEELFSHSNS